ncbi:MAG: sodium:solute symporter [Bacteroidetes bacterium GWF2_33_16]|nr:MAG: sodium:solute symporter [Bacteroidetes bacterium GWE2_32_14]OFY07825.1 MAG: sodium:solute symporter [Bacteroidetes bacterium GWF2_33_16]
MNPYHILFILFVYFGMLLVVSHFTSRNATNESFFLGNRKSPWYIVAFGMIGASLSGVTFISVPGWVVDSNFSYMQVVLGYLVGYAVIAHVLMPMYYRLNLTSIYSYLEKRFGFYSYKTGASFFLLSRLIGSAFRLFLVANVLQITVFNALNIPFEVSVFVTIFLIWLYTFKGGIKTIIWTDTLQTVFMLMAVGATIILLAKNLNLNFSGILHTVIDNEHSKIFYFESFKDQYYFFKQFLSGAFIAIVMTGLDQDMMQKNLSCRNIKDAQKNMYWFSIILVPVNLMFMSLGVLLVVFAQKNGIEIPARTDNLYPLIATQGFVHPIIGITFIIGLVAAAYSSADSALTALTTSFTVDILNAGQREEKKLKKLRKLVHLAISLVMVVVIILFNAINNESVISAIFKVAGYTYGPLLGLYAFGLFTRKVVKDKYVPIVAIISPVLCIFLNYYSVDWFHGYKFGFEILLVNGLLTFLGLLIISKHNIIAEEV